MIDLVVYLVQIGAALEPIDQGGLGGEGEVEEAADFAFGARVQVVVLEVEVEGAGALKLILLYRLQLRAPAIILLPKTANEQWFVGLLSHF